MNYFPLYLRACKEYDITTAFIGCYEFARLTNYNLPKAYKKAIYTVMPTIVSRSTYNRKKPVNKGFFDLCIGEFIPIKYERAGDFNDLLELVLFSFLEYRFEVVKMPFLLARKGDMFGDLRAVTSISDKQYLRAIKDLEHKGCISTFTTRNNNGIDLNIIWEKSGGTA